MTSKTRDPEATRTAILEAAEELFLINGFNGTALSEIAARAGVTKSLLHHHFGPKESLWHEVKVRRFSDYAERQMTMLAEQQPTADLLRESMQTYFRFLQKNPQLVRILAWVFLEQQQDECATLDEALTRAGIDKIRQAQEQGELRDDLNPAFILFTFIGIAQHWFQDKAHVLDHMGLSAQSELVDEAYLNDVVRIFFEGVLPR